MPKISVTVEVSTPQEAQAVVNALANVPPFIASNPAAHPVAAVTAAPQPVVPLATANGSVYTPPPAAPAYPTPPAGGYAPPPGAPVMPQAHPPVAAQPAMSITETQLAQAAQAYAKAYGAKAAKAKLGELGVKAIGEIPKDAVSYQRALAALTVQA